MRRIRITPVTRQMCHELVRQAPDGHYFTPPRKPTLARVAGQLCTNPRFQAWLGAANSEQAAQVLRDRCGVASRRELNSNHEAAQRFHALRRQFAYGDHRP